MKALVLAAMFAVPSAAWADGPYQFYPLSPCRVVDTRNPNGVNGGPALDTSARAFAIRGNCSVPMTAKAATLNITVTGASMSSWLTIWPSNQAKPFVSTINFDATDPALANGAVVPLGTDTQDLSVANAYGSVHVIIDVTGYYQ